MNRLYRVLFWLSIGVLFYRPLYSQEYPQRIVSLGSSITEELFLLGVGDKIVGNTIYCTRPKDAQNKRKVGTVIKVNLEKIVELKPDLVLATSLTDRKQLRKMKDLKINVVEIFSEKNFSEICENFIKLGALLGKKELAEAIIKQAKIDINYIKNKIKDLPKQKVLIQIGIRPLFVATKDFFLNDLIELAGGINIARDSTSGLYSREEVIKQNPDVLIITTMGIEGKEEMQSWQRYKVMEAVTNDRIYIMDSYKLCSPTPVSFIETLKELVQILHPSIVIDEQKIVYPAPFL